MGNCCGSAATVPSETLPGPPVIEPRQSTPAPLQPNIKERSSVPSSRPLSGPHSHSSASKHKSTHHSGRSPQDPIPRSRTRSAPQAPQTFKSPSPQDSRPRARSVVQSKRSCRSDSRLTGPGETIIESHEFPLTALKEQAKSGVRSPTVDYPSRRALNSTVKQVLTENPQYVAQFLAYRLHPQLSIDSGFSWWGRYVYATLRRDPGQTDTTLIHREAPENPRSSMLFSECTCRCVFSLISHSSLFNLPVPRKQGRAGNRV